jgi:hypothetical protein
MAESQAQYFSSGAADIHATPPVLFKPTHSSDELKREVARISTALASAEESLAELFSVQQADTASSNRRIDELKRAVAKMESSVRLLDERLEDSRSTLNEAIEQTHRVAIDGENKSKKRYDTLKRVIDDALARHAELEELLSSQVTKTSANHLGNDQRQVRQVSDWLDSRSRQEHSAQTIRPSTIGEKNSGAENRIGWGDGVLTHPSSTNSSFLAAMEDTLLLERGPALFGETSSSTPQAQPERLKRRIGADASQVSTETDFQQNPHLDLTPGTIAQHQYVADGNAARPHTATVLSELAHAADSNPDRVGSAEAAAAASSNGPQAQADVEIQLARLKEKFGMQ